VILLGGAGIIVPGIGWLVGLGMLWSSRVWSGRDKLLGTILSPGLLLLPILLVLSSGSDVCVRTASGARHCGGGGSSAALVIGVAVLVIVPVLVAVYLYRRARSGPAVA